MWDVCAGAWLKIDEKLLKIFFLFIYWLLMVEQKNLYPWGLIHIMTMNVWSDMRGFSVIYIWITCEDFSKKKLKAVRFEFKFRWISNKILKIFEILFRVLYFYSKNCILYILQKL